MGIEILNLFPGKIVEREAPGINYIKRNSFDGVKTKTVLSVFSRVSPES